MRKGVLLSLLLLTPVMLLRGSMEFLAASSHCGEGELEVAHPADEPVTLFGRFFSYSLHNGVIVTVSGIDSRYTLEVTTANQIIARSVTGTGNFSQAAYGNYGTNGWRTAAAVFSAPNRRVVYFEGNPRATNTTPQSVTNCNMVLIGARSAFGQYGNHFHGLLAEVAAWNTELTAEEILRLHEGHNPKSIRLGNLIAHSVLNRDATNAVPNFFGPPIHWIGSNGLPQPNPAMPYLFGGR